MTDCMPNGTASNHAVRSRIIHDELDPDATKGRRELPGRQKGALAAERRVSTRGGQIGRSVPTSTRL